MISEAFRMLFQVEYLIHFNISFHLFGSIEGDFLTCARKKKKKKT